MNASLAALVTLLVVAIATRWLWLHHQRSLYRQRADQHWSRPIVHNCRCAWTPPTAPATPGPATFETVPQPKPRRMMRWSKR